jgi:nitrite reductase (NO-forming)
MRGFWPIRDLPVVLWLLAVLLVALLRSSVPAPRWLLLHLMLLGAVTNAIMVWSRHFADALLHTPPRDGDRRAQSARLLLLNLGVLVVLAGVLSSVWQVTAVGATAVAVAAAWQGLALLRLTRRALPCRFGGTVRYYVAAAGFLPVGAALGAGLAGGLTGAFHEQVVVAHATVNVLGWVGLTVVGTLVTLWPTMLRTRIADGAERAARRALPVLVLAIVTAAGGALAGVQVVAALGVVGYLAGLALMTRPFIAAARRSPPSSYPTRSVLAGVCWLLCCLATLAIGIATASSWGVAGDRVGRIAPYLAAGFGAQVLLGALSYLLPMALAGGPAPVRAANAVLDTYGRTRVMLINTGLLATVLPVAGPVRTACSVIVLAGLASFLPLLLLAFRASRRAKQPPALEPLQHRVGGDQGGVGPDRPEHRRAFR